MGTDRIRNPASIDASERPGVLPHEWCFGFFLALTWMRLAVRGGTAAAWSFAFLGCLLASFVAIGWTARRPTATRWRIRLLFYPAAMGVAFFAMGRAVPLLGVPPADALLLGWDRALLGETPAVAWEPYLRPWLTDLSMTGYLFFFFYLIAGPAHYCVRDLPLFRKCFVGLFTLYGIGFVGYTLFPAGGPHRFLTFNTALHGPWIFDWSLATVNAASNRVDVFPSIHVAATFYLLLFDWSHHRRRFAVFLLPCLLLWFSTLYLRFHYFVDLAAGALIALAGWSVAELYEDSALWRRVEAEDAVSLPAD